MTKLKFWSRFDIQATILSSVAVVVSSLTLFFISYHYAYSNMLDILKNQAIKANDYILSEMDISSYSKLNSSEDFDSEIFVETKAILDDVRKIINAKYLYTAGYNEKDELIYIVDASPTNSPDFRYPGELIEYDFLEPMQKAMNGELAFPCEINHSRFGNVFTVYSPVFNRNDVVIGAICIEFYADSQYYSYRKMVTAVPIVVFTCVIITAVIAFIFFRRISNPAYKDLSTSDSLTNLKNQTGFDLDVKNLIAKRKLRGSSVVFAEICRLDYINETYGNHIGNEFLLHFARLVMQFSAKNQLCYRIDSSRFAVFCVGMPETKIAAYIDKLKLEFSKFTLDEVEECETCFGYAFCDGNTTNDFKTAVALADNNLFKAKKHYYEELANARIIS